jgi:hypothetical protein
VANGDQPYTKIDWVRISAMSDADMALTHFMSTYIAVSGRVRDTSTQEAIEINRLE